MCMYAGDRVLAVMQPCGHSIHRPPSLALAARGRSCILLCWIIVSCWIRIQVITSKEETTSVCYRTESNVS